MIRYRLSPQLLWALLAGQLAVLIPYRVFLPWWIYFIFGISAFWRWMVAYGYWSLPKTSAVYGIGIASALITFLNFGFTREAAVALLSLAFSLKLLELKALRDSMIIIFLGYFLLVVYFLYSNSFGTAVYVFVAFILLTVVLIGLNRIGDILPIGGVLQKALILILQAIPLAGITFIFFPRIGIPLWVPNVTGVGVSGFSRTIEPGSISELAQSNQVVFRAKFNGKEPLQRDLYWRGLVLSHFDGRRWSMADTRTRLNPPEWISKKNRALSYEVFLEPTHHAWLFAIEKLIHAKGEIIQMPEGRLEAKTPVQKKFGYQAYSILNGEENFKVLGERELKTLGELPLNVNPKSRILAKALFAKTNANPGQYIALVLNHFRRNAYVYTLKPPRLSAENSMDDFLLYTKKGFCEHYATAFTFLMRAVQIPARVVVGYQGGEFNPYTSYWTVRAYHAHAWSEVWLPNKGWVRVDPTEAVSPNRIELGVDEDVKARIAQNKRSFLLAWLERNSGKPFFANFLWGMDALETFWQSVIVDERQADQKSLLRWFLPRGFAVAPFVLVLIVLMGVVFVFLSLTFLFKRTLVTPQDPVLKAYRMFCRKLAKIGVAREKGEGPQDFIDRVIRIRPDLRKVANEFNELYITLQYRELHQDKQAVKDLYGKVRQLNL